MRHLCRTLQSVFIVLLFPEVKQIIVLNQGFPLENMYDMMKISRASQNIEFESF